jgi:hypothetical protein
MLPAKPIGMIAQSFLAFILATGLSITCSFSQNLRITCEAPDDTVSISEPILIKVVLHNTSNAKDKLPDGFHVKSNYFPNGLDFPQEGIELYFNFSPIAPEAKVFIERLSVIKPTKFYAIRSGKETEFEVDISRHLNYIRKVLKKENREIPLNVVYSLTCRASNSLYFLDEKKISTMFMNIQSEPVTFYVSR